MNARIAARSAALVAGLLLAASAAAQKADPAKAPETEPPDTWYAQALAHSDVGINVTHFWSKDGMLRAETVIAGRRVVTIVTHDTYYAYDLLVRTGLAIQRSPIAVREDAERGRPFGNEWQSLVRQGAEKVRDEKLGGRETELYQLTDKQGRRRVWVSKDEPRLPLRVEVFRRATAQVFVTDFLNWQRGLPIADAFFRPEDGVNMGIMTYQEYVAEQATREPIGPVPVLYGDLLHGY